jgi:penicillin-insensitive murein DD-endopeptidase
VRLVLAATAIIVANSGAAARANTPAPDRPATVVTPRSVSCGAANRGALANGTPLAFSGPSHVIPEPWRSRNRHFGTNELVALIARAADAVAQTYPGAQLGVADLSPPQGGASVGHRSHQSGRDADLHYYALASDGTPMAPDQHFPYYGRRGRAAYARTPVRSPHIPERFFDRDRNWALVRALITDPEVAVERVFVSTRIRRWLLQHAVERGEDEAVLKRARELLREPQHGDSHNDHMHVRIACSANDVALGRCGKNVAIRSRHRRRSSRQPLACPRPERDMLALPTSNPTVLTAPSAVRPPLHHP